jgi:hypothetical protein
MFTITSSMHPVHGPGPGADRDQDHEVATALVAELGASWDAGRSIGWAARQILARSGHKSLAALAGRSSSCRRTQLCVGSNHSTRGPRLRCGLQCSPPTPTPRQTLPLLSDPYSGTTTTRLLLAPLGVLPEGKCIYLY